MKSARKQKGARFPLVKWAVVAVILSIAGTAYFLFFYGHLIGGKLGDHVESVLRPITLLVHSSTASSDEEEERTRGRAAPTRILPPAPRTELTPRQEESSPPEPRTYEKSVLAENLVSPDGIAIHPLTGEIYVSEEDAWAISLLGPSGAQRVIDRDTPVFRLDNQGERERVQSLRFPEGIAFSSDGTLYAVEDLPGGRLIHFVQDDSGAYPEGEVIPLPGIWDTYAWEGLDIGPRGEILMAGSDIEHLSQQEEIGVFTGSILYRDEQGAWWLPYHRFFASFSDARFSKSGQEAIYTCEVTGEIGWLNLSSRYTLGGHSERVGRSPEGVGVMPDGTFMVAEEVGSILHIDPASDRSKRIITGLSDIESVIWDERRARLLVTEDGTGRVLAFTPDHGFDQMKDRMMYATFYPAFSQQNVPQECPEYLARILELGGVRFDSDAPDQIGFREFVSRIPMVAANLEAVSMNPDREPDDPVERVQFVIFEPNRMRRPADGLPSQAFALFGVRKQSGELVTTSLLPVQMLSATAPEEELTDHGLGLLAVPTASAVSVSGIGVAAVQFMGMGRTPDYSLVLNPRNPTDSYMVVFHTDGRREHYRLNTAGGRVSDDWVIAYSHIRHDAWQRLSYGPGESVSEAETVDVSRAGR